MKRLATIGLFVLVAQALAFATTLDLSNSGTIGSTASTSGPPTAGQPFSVTDQLNSGPGTVTITTGNLTSLGGGEFVFNSGTASVVNGSQVLFQGTFGSGTVNEIAGLIELVASSGNGFQTLNVVITPSGAVQGTMIVTSAPEPGTLGLMATGIVGVAGMLRRKLPL